MFNRKALFMALLAVFLLSSFKDGNAGIDQYRKRKPRKIAADVIVEIDPNLQRASLTNQTNQAAGIAAADPNDQANLTDKGRRRPRKPRVSVDPGGLNQVAGGIAGIDPNFQRASLTNQTNLVAGIATADPDNYQANFTDKRKRIKPRASIHPGGLNQVAGAILGMDANI